MVQRVSLINSNNTQLNSDYDFSKIEKYLMDETTGVLFSDLSNKPEFDLDLWSGELSAGTAIVKCTRTASQPIANQSFYVIFQSSETVSVNVSVGRKIFIEIENSLVQDPTLIEDTPPSTDYAQWFNIGSIKSETSYPAHWNYIKLFEIASWPTKVDYRQYPQIKWDLIDFSSLTKDIITTGNIVAGWDIDADWEISWDRVFQNTYQPPVAWNELTPKDYVDWQILQSTWVESLVDKDTYILWEDADAGDSVFVEDMVAFVYADQVQAIWDTAGNTRVSIPAFWSGTASNTLKLALRKYVSPWVDLWIRIETDNVGEPSWTLFDADAIATVTEASLTTSLVDTTVTLAGNITIPKGTKVHIVLFAGAYGSETINATNYFGVGYADKNTTTRPLNTYDWSVWGTADNDKFMYVSSDLFTQKLLSKTDATYSYKLPTDVPRIATENKSAGEHCITVWKWYADYFSWMTPLTPMYIADTPWEIWLIEWTNPYMLWYPIDTNTLYVWFKSYPIWWTTNEVVALNTERTTTSTSFVVWKSTIIQSNRGPIWIYRISFDLWLTSAVNQYARILVNWVEIQSWTQSSWIYITRSVDTILKQWDFVVLEYRTQHAYYYAWIRNFNIKFDLQETQFRLDGTTNDID